jgi:hypothetical protein
MPSARRRQRQQHAHEGANVARLKQKTSLPESVREQLREILSYFRTPRTRDRILEDVLTDDERHEVGDRSSPEDTLQVYSRCRRVCLERALLDIALEASIIDTGLHRRLRRHIGEPVESVDSRPRPSWSAKTGKLHFRGKLVRTVDLDRGDNIRLILDSFEDHGWPPGIDNPLTGGADSKKLRDTLESLKQGLSVITFAAKGSGTRVTWDEVKQLRRDSGA